MGSNANLTPARLEISGHLSEDVKSPEPQRSLLIEKGTSHEVQGRSFSRKRLHVYNILLACSLKHITFCAAAASPHMFMRALWLVKAPPGGVPNEPKKGFRVVAVWFLYLITNVNTNVSRRIIRSPSDYLRLTRFICFKNVGVVFVQMFTPWLKADILLGCFYVNSLTSW